MKPFEVLSREQSIHRHLLLEASAGTGKTFSIQHLVARLLIEEEPLSPPSIEEILVVTFTRAATRELFQRIRSNLEVVREALLKGEGVTDYVQKALDEGEGATGRAVERLTEALFCFDQAQIFTIHGFASRMLRESVEGRGAVGAEESTEEGVNERALLQGVRDYFRTQEVRERVTTEQLNGVVSSLYRRDGQRFLEHLAKVASGRFLVAPTQGAQELIEEFARVAQRWSIHPEQFLADCTHAAPHVKKVSQRKKPTEAALATFHSWAQLLERGEWGERELTWVAREGWQFLKLLHEGPLYAQGESDWRHEAFTPSIIYLSLKEIVEKWLDPLHTFQILAKGCQDFFQEIREQRELEGPDHLLELFGEAVKEPLVAHGVRTRYRAAIIDEFQDTDPLQWEIFQELFLSEDWSQGHLYLVGDPKQSIYRFRSADIYTYLNAAEGIGEEGRYQLSTNYRSQSALVQGLNTLFSSPHVSGWMALPQREEAMECEPVQASGGIAPYPFQDDKKSVHFFVARGRQSRMAKKWPSESLEEEQLFPFIAAEIGRLKVQSGMSYQVQAVLVRDHLQGERLISFLKEQGIPAVARKGKKLTETPLYQSLLEWLEAIEQPKKERRVRRALGGVLGGWSDRELQQLEEPQVYSRILSLLYHLRSLWLHEGVGALCLRWLELSWKQDGRVSLQRVLALPEGENCLEQYQQLMELLICAEQKGEKRPDQLLSWMRGMEQELGRESAALRIRSNPSEDAVVVMTIHMSKGLEFPVVYALGLAQRSLSRRELIPCSREGREVLDRVDPLGSDQRRHLEEEDAEKMRQLYVAMTRAKQRLYLPLCFEESGEPPPLGSASPLELFFSRFCFSAPSYAALYEGMGELKEEKLRSGLLEEGKEFFSWSEGAGEGVPLPREEPKETRSKGAAVLVPEKRVLLTSFSHLREGVQKRRVREAAPVDFSHPLPTVDTLPAGKETGVLLHALLESFPLGAPLPMDWLEGELQTSSFFPWKEVVAELLERAFQTILPLLGCALCEISPQKMKREMDFLFHAPFGEGKDEKFVKGVMDLFFEHEGRYYFVDWKSNWLARGYGGKSLAVEMEERGYLIQAKIYGEALRRYLALYHEAPFEELFGGAFFLFLRGMKEGEGVVHLSAKDLEERSWDWL